MQKDIQIGVDLTSDAMAMETMKAKARNTAQQRKEHKAASEG